MRASNPIEERVVAVIEPAADALGLRVVRVRLTGLRRKRLQIMAERRSDGGMGVGECEALSRAISPLLDEADPIKGEYDLEVSSPGIDRPLVAPEDFARFIGHEAKFESRELIEGRRRFRGEIVAADADTVQVTMPEGGFELPIAMLSEARLVLTDKLIAEDLKRAERELAAADLDLDPEIVAELGEAAAPPPRKSKRKPQ